MTANVPDAARATEPLAHVWIADDQAAAVQEQVFRRSRRLWNFPRFANLDQHGDALLMVPHA